MQPSLVFLAHLYQFYIMLNTYIHKYSRNYIDLFLHTFIYERGQDTKLKNGLDCIYFLFNKCILYIGT